MAACGHQETPLTEGRWIDLTHVVVTYDHPHHALFEDAISLDFVNSALGPGSRIAVEISLDAAKALSAALQSAIRQAEFGGRGGYDSIKT